MDSCPVRVALRVRPLSTKEINEGGGQCVSLIPNTSQVVVGSDRSFTFDHVFSPEASQELVYQSCAAPLVEKLMDGFNATIFAYGQTGSGKTFSMGTSVEYSESPNIQGIIPRAINNIFDTVHQRKKESPHYQSEILITFLELYNEELIDLLNPDSPSTKPSGSRPNSYHSVKGPTIREDPQGGIYWKGVTEIPVETPGEVMDYLYKGLICRTTASTDMNATSSRSHAIFSITIKQVMEVEDPSIVNDNETEILSDAPDNTPSLRHLTSKFHFVDLAGSERLKKTHAVGGRAKEGISINAGLLALGNVISALGDESRKSSHIPYRDSKLTRLLQDSIGGNSQTLMLACISPSDTNFLETLNTLKYANRARNIKNRVQINQGMANPAEEISRLRAEVSRLKNQLHSQSTHVSPSNEQTNIRKQAHVRNLENRILELTEELVVTQADRDILLLKASEDHDLKLQKYLTTAEITDYAQMVLELRRQLEAYKSNIDGIIPKPESRLKGTHKSKSSNVANNRLSMSNFIQTPNLNADENFQNYLVEINGDSKALQSELDEISLNIANLSLLNNQDDDNSDGTINSDTSSFIRRRPQLLERVADLRANGSIKSVGNTPLSTPPELPDFTGSDPIDSRIQKYQNEIRNLQYRLNVVTRERDIALKGSGINSDRKSKLGVNMDRSHSDNSNLLASPEGSVKSIADPSTARLQEELQKSLETIKLQSRQIRQLRSQHQEKIRASSQLALRDTVEKKPISSYPDFKSSLRSTSGLRSAYKKKLLEHEIHQFLLGRKARKALKSLKAHLEKLINEQTELNRKREELAKNMTESVDPDSDDISDKTALTQIEEIDERLGELEAEIDYTTERVRTQEASIAAQIKGVNQQHNLNTILKDDLCGESNYRAALKILFELEPGEVQGMFELILRDLVTLKMSQSNLQNKIRELSEDLSKKELMFNSFQRTVANITRNYENRIRELTVNNGTNVVDSFDPFQDLSDSELEDLDAELAEVERQLNENN